MAGFPSRHAMTSGLPPRLRRTPRRTSDRRGLTHERLEQRALMAADSFAGPAPCMLAGDMWTPPAEVAPEECMHPAAAVPWILGSGDVPLATWADRTPEPLPEGGPGCGPLVEPDTADSMGPAAISEPADVWQTMAAMSAASESTAGPQADDEDGRIADMQREMSLFYLNVPPLPASNAFPANDSMDAVGVARLDEIDAAAAEALQSPPTLDASLGGSWRGEIIAGEYPPVDRTVSPKDEAVNAWVSPDLTGLTLSGVTPSRSTAVAIPTYSMATGGTPLTAADLQEPERFALTVSAIQGGVYDPQAVWAAQQQVVESTRWTAIDRAAKLAAAAAYSTEDGGLLRDVVQDYDPTGATGRYGKVGFSAVLIRASDASSQVEDNLYILAFRGTDNKRDWLTNIAQAAGFHASQFDQSIRLAADVQQSLPAGSSLITTGHSKGGAQAVAASYAIGTPAIVFNPSSVSDVYRQGVPGSIVTHITFGDPLSTLRTIQNVLDSMDPPSMQDLRAASGEIIVHPPRSLWTHSLDSLPR